MNYADSSKPSLIFNCCSNYKISYEHSNYEKNIKYQLFEETYFQDFQQQPHMLQHMPAGATPPTQAYSQVTPQVGTETRPLFA